MGERLLTPSKVTAWLDCPHYLTLRHQVDDGTLARPEVRFGSLARLIADKGLAHEVACLDDYRAQGRAVYEVPERGRGESFASWVDRVGDPFQAGHDVIFQMPLVHDGMRGIADFLVRGEHPTTGEVTWEPVDAKLARAAAKPGHVLQLCFYADALHAGFGITPGRIHLWLGSGRIESLHAGEVGPYWRRLRHQLRSLMDAELGLASHPEPCSHCDFCEFADTCTEVWRAEDSLIYVAGIRRSERHALAAADVPTLAGLAGLAGEIDDLPGDRLARLVQQASLQVLAREAPDDPPPHRIIEPGDDPTWGQGFTLLPQPDDGDVFLDYEGHPFWRADAGLFFLFGLITLDEGRWTYHADWAHDLDGEAAATKRLIDFLVERREAHPGMHVYHYNHTERSALERLSADHGVGEVALAELIETGLFVDLYSVARNTIQVGAESYGLKHLERLAAFERGDDIYKGANAVVEYERYTSSGEASILDAIASYNEDDVRATLALRDWLVEHRPPIDWRMARLEVEQEHPELDEQIEALHAYGPDTPENLLGDLLGYWLREWRAHIGPRIAQVGSDSASLRDDPTVLAGLVCEGEVERLGKRGKPITPGMRFRFPPQVHDDLQSSAQVVFTSPDGLVGYSSIDALDSDAGTVDLLWNDKCQELGVTPAAIVLNDWVSPRPKPEALGELATAVLDPMTMPNPVALALLRRDLPAFVDGQGPTSGIFTDDLDEMREWVRHLDHSYVAIQGPPGTGKTFRGAHLVLTLLEAGQRVGITAMSHHAVENLLDAVLDLAEERGELHLVRAVRRVKHRDVAERPGVENVLANKTCAKEEYNLIGGTTWLFAGNDMHDAPVDVLIVDEAGQLALADALAAARSARNLVLLGDPLQLPQVAQATHPDGSGASVLEHVLGDEVTMPADRGVFLPETRRMHPDVCGFISDEIYEGRLTSHSTCAGQVTDAGTGLIWLQVDHADCSTESEEEAEVVAAEIAKLVGLRWTNQHGVEAPLTVDDVMVVAPYTKQVKLMRARLDRDPVTRGVSVGTVDKFQGRQAAVVFFTMTTSSADDMPRGSEFLFSRNRMNVAISRARCLAYLVCTEALLDTRARSVDEMRLISTLCSFVEHATVR